MSETVKVQRALISVSDKTGIVEFASALAGFGVELLSTGGTYRLLQESGLNYVGNIEPKEFVKGAADVAVTDGFTGNLILKTAEAIASYMSQMIGEEIRANPLTTLGGLLAKPAFSRVRQRLNPDEVGGAPLLGVNGVVIIGHGRSNAYAIKQAVGQARRAAEQGIVDAIRQGIAGRG